MIENIETSILLYIIIFFFIVILNKYSMKNTISNGEVDALVEKIAKLEKQLVSQNIRLESLEILEEYKTKEV